MTKRVGPVNTKQRCFPLAERKLARRRLKMASEWRTDVENSI
jgi:hypothetical protein